MVLIILNIINSVEEQEKLCKRLTDDNIKISLIPTMGNLHLGHESLLKASLNDDYRIVSLFVNPLQFNDYRDYNNDYKHLYTGRDIFEEWESEEDFISLDELFEKGVLETSFDNDAN